MNRNNSKGFTLLELLVVIGVIGILAAVVLASLSSARAKGKEKAILSQLSTMRSQAGIYFNENGNYGTGYTSVRADSNWNGVLMFATSSCDSIYSNNAAPLFISTSTGSLIELLKGACRSGATSIYATVQASGAGPATAWAVRLTTPTSSTYCVDSTGILKSPGSFNTSLLNASCL